MSKFVTATISEVESALVTLKTLCATTPGLEGQYGKKFGAVVELLTLKDGVTKDLNQAYTNAEKKWAVNYANDLDSCSKINKLEKIRQYVLVADGYTRHFNNADTKLKVENWLAEKFSAPAPVEPELDQAA